MNEHVKQGYQDRETTKPEYYVIMISTKLWNGKWKIMKNNPNNHANDIIAKLWNYILASSNYFVSGIITRITIHEAWVNLMIIITIWQ